MIQEQYYKTDVIQSHDRIVVGLGTPQFRGAVSNQLINDATRLSSFVCIFRTIIKYAFTSRVSASPTK